jgi:ATP-binding cassette, subfamily B, bacterial
MQDTTFARARKFLDYHPLAKWLAHISSAATAVLYVALLAVLGLFIDLVVNRGELPPFYDLPVVEKRAFFRELNPDDSDALKSLQQQVCVDLKDLGIDEAQAREWLNAATPDTLSQHETLVLWTAELPHLLRQVVSDRAAELVRTDLRDRIERRGLELTINQPLPDYGILSLVVRSHATFGGWFIRLLARFNGWMWEYGDLYYLQGLFILGSVLALVRLLLMFVADYLAAIAVLEAVTRLRRAIYHHTNRLGTLAFRALGPSEAVSVSTRHLESVHEGLYRWLTIYSREPVKFGLLIAFALLLNFWLAMAFLLFAVLVWLIGGQTAAYFRRRGRQADLRAAEQLSLIQESLMLMRLVKVYLMEQFNQARVERQLRAYAQAQAERYIGQAIYRPLFFFLGLFAALVLLVVGGHVVLQGQLSVTTAQVLATILVSLYWPAVALLDARRGLRRTRDSAGVLFSFLDRQGGVGQALEAEFLPGLAQSLEFDKVTLKEPGTGRRLLRGVSLTIQAGQRIAIVGPEEMEKHALVYLLPRFLDPTSGEIRIDGKNIRWVTLDSLRAQIAMVLQHNLVFNDTVANNIGCGEPAYNLQRIIDAAKRAHAHQFIQKLPQGYETPIGEMGHPLKLGEKFRIALARAILREPSLYIIEEPSVPQDDDTKALIDDTFNRILPGRTVIFLPHRLSTIRRCDRVFLLYQGEIEASGEHRELLANNELYRHLQYLEFNEFAGLISPPAPLPEESSL